MPGPGQLESFALGKTEQIAVSQWDQGFRGPGVHQATDQITFLTRADNLDRDDGLVDRLQPYLARKRVYLFLKVVKLYRGIPIARRWAGTRSMAICL